MFFEFLNIKYILFYTNIKYILKYHNILLFVYVPALVLPKTTLIVLYRAGPSYKQPKLGL
jgi:hypothetical protein